MNQVYYFLVFTVVVAGLLVASSLMPGANEAFQGQEPLSRAETLKLVKDDLARRLKIDVTEIEVTVFLPMVTDWLICALNPARLLT